MGVAPTPPPSQGGVLADYTTSPRGDWSRRQVTLLLERVYKTRASLLCHAGKRSCRPSGQTELPDGFARLIGWTARKMAPKGFGVNVPAENRTRDSTFAESCDFCFTTGTKIGGSRRSRTVPSCSSDKRSPARAFEPLVLPHGNAPWSVGYQPTALQLSYGRKGCVVRDCDRERHVFI